MRLPIPITRLLTTSLLAIALPVLGDSQVQHRFSGFATLGITSNDNPNLVYRRDVIQDQGSYDGKLEWRTDTLVGAQWQGLWTHAWETSVQVVAKDRFEGSLDDAVEWAYVRYRPEDGLDLRLGRLGVDIFMLSDYRLVGYAYPWVRPPHETYGLLSMYHIDGADITKRFDIGDSSLSLKAFYGRFKDDYPTSYRSNDSVGLQFEPYGFSTVLEKGAWKWRATYVNANLRDDYAGSLIDALNAAGPYWPEAMEWSQKLRTHNKNAGYFELGMDYDSNNWWVQSELVRINSDTSLIGNSDHGYLSIGRRFGNLSVFAMAGFAEPRDRRVVIIPPAEYPPPLAGQLEQLAQATQGLLNGVRIDQRSVSLGTRWDFRPRMALKFQVDDIDIATHGTNLWFTADETVTSDQSATVISLTLDVLF